MASVLEEKDAIRELLHEYCYRMDQHRFVELAELFTEDGEWITPYARAKGRAEMAALWARIVPAGGEGPGRLHYVMNTIISVHGDRADARSNYLVVLEMPEGLAPSVCGTYYPIGNWKNPIGNWKLGAAANGEAEPLVRTCDRRAGPTRDRT